MKYYLGILLAVAFSAPAFGGVWDEAADGGGDAGNYPLGAFQTTIGLVSDPMLTLITGTTADPDFHDAYLINIVDPNWDIAAAGFDTRLWLFDSAGNLLMSNDDNFTIGLTAQLTPVAAWGGGVFNGPVDPVLGDTHVLVISGFSEEIHDAADVALSQGGGDFTDLRGINPAAGAIDHWENDVDPSGTPATGGYEITLTGVEFGSVVPEPTSGLVLAGMGLVVLARRRRK